MVQMILNSINGLKLLIGIYWFKRRLIQNTFQLLSNYYFWTTLRSDADTSNFATYPDSTELPDAVK